MKKALVQTLMAAAAVATIVACKPNNDSSNNQSGDTGGTMAATPTVNCNIYGNTSCNPGQFQQFGTQFISYYGTYSAGQFCGCPAGYRPIMTPQWGLNCAPDVYFPNNGYRFHGYHYSQVSLAAQNNQWTGIPQDIYRPVNANQTCYDYAAAVCDTRLNQSNGTNPHCGSFGGTCQQTSGGSSLGVCSSQQGYGFGQINGYGYGYGGGGFYGNQQPGCFRYVGSYSWVNVCVNNGYGAGGGTLPR